MPSARLVFKVCAAGLLITLAGLGVPLGRAAAEPANAPLFYDQRRLPDMEVERRNQEVIDEQRRITASRRSEAEALERKRAEEVRQTAEAGRRVEAERKAEDEKRVALEAEAKRKAEDEKRVALEAEAKRKAEDEKRVAAEAEVKRKAEDEKRVALEAEAKRKADSEKQLAATQTQRVPSQTAALIPPITSSNNPATVPAGSCDAAKVSASPLPGGRLQIAIDSPCRRAQNVTLQYGGYDIVRRIGPGGQANVALDLFMGTAATVTAAFADGSSLVLDAGAGGMSDVSKVALIWQSPVDLDLHALEGGGAFGKQGHRWSGAVSTMDAAKADSTENGRGAGFMSSIDDGAHEGTKIEVYTFVHSPEQDTGAVSMLIDYASRGAKPQGEMCGQGALAEIPFTVVILDRKGRTATENGIVPAAKCGEALAGNARYLRGAVPDLRFRN